MENEIWATKYQQSVPTGLERTEDHLNNGNTEKEGDDLQSKYAGKDFPEGFIKTEPGQETCPSVTISEKGKQTIEVILEQIKSLSPIEKFLLFLKLPSEVTNAVDPFRQPLNPLGNRSEIYRTISWIKTHLEEDPDISLPKQEVYNDYYNYCETNSIKPLSQADFGKVMKQVNPRVRARRLGTRGNSRYCYSGLRRCIQLNPPFLPDLSDKPMSTEAPFTQSSLNSAAWVIVKDWSEQQFRTEFSSIQSLAYHLILNHSIGTGSEAASKIVSAAETSMKGESNKVGSKHREMQIQLQKKLQQKNEGKEKKRKLQSPKSEQKPGGKKCRSQSLPAAAAVSTSSPTTQLITMNGGGGTASGECSTASSSTSTSPTQGKTICDKSIEFTQLPALPDFKSFQKPAEGLLLSSRGQETNLGATPLVSKVPIPRLHSTPQQAAGPSPATKRSVSKSAKYKSLQPSLQRHCDIAPTYNPQPPLSQPQRPAAEENRSQDFNNDVGNRIKEKQSDEDNGDCDEDVVLTRERINSVSNVEKDAMDEYLGTNNSQHEEELSKYFSNNNLSDSEHTSKLSTLRQLLEQNGIAETKPSVQNGPDNKVMTEAVTFSNSSLNPTPVQNEMTYIHNNLSSVPVNFKRRVSFETPMEEPVPPSPNTRRKNFSFTPISPGPQSPNNGVQSKCSSTTASPFVSPRNTPILRTKSTHQSTIVKSEVRKSIKLKREDLTIEIPQEGQFSGPNFTAPMSAPASPMLKKLLNSSSKVSYHPGYNVPSIPSTPEVSEVQFFPSNVQSNMDSYRSQSAPAHELMTVKPNFPIDSNLFIPEQTTSTNDFAEIDPIPESENDKVKQILNSLDEQACDNNNIDNIFIDIGTNNSCLPEFGLQYINTMDINQLAQNELPFNPPRTLRSQSMDMATTYETKCNPSRSVPCTPVPFTQNVKIPSKMNYNSSRSYPSTPLNTEETFSYSVNTDCLLNGTPIRSDSLAENLDYMSNFEVNGDNIDKGFSVANQEFSLIENDPTLMDNCVLLEQNYGEKIN